MNSENVISFPKCRECLSEDTIAKMMMAEYLVSGVVAPGTFLSLRKEVGQFPKPDALGNIITLIVHHDACANCGAERITRVEKKRQNPVLRANIPPHGFSPS